MGSVGKYLSNNYNVYMDGPFDLIIIPYRAVGITIVRAYMVELERTVGVDYFEPPLRPKKGSLAQDMHLLD
jgi:hypothetical protein